MTKYYRLTNQEWSEDIDLKKELGYSHIYKRLHELEDKIENGELVNIEWHDEQVLHAKSEIKRLQSENKTLRLAKDDFKKRLNDSGHRNKKLSLKLGSLKKEIRNAKTEAVEEFSENLEALCFDETFYMDLHDTIDKLLKEFFK